MDAKLSGVLKMSGLLKIHWLRPEPQSQFQILTTKGEINVDIVTATIALRKEGIVLRIVEIEESGDNKEVELEEVDIENTDALYCAEIDVFDSEASAKKFNQLLEQWKYNMNGYN